MEQVDGRTQLNLAAYVRIERGPVFFFFRALPNVIYEAHKGWLYGDAAKRSTSSVVDLQLDAVI